MLAAELYMIVFRSIHILCGVLWVGSTFLFSVFLGPAAAEVGPSAGPLLRHVVIRQKVTKVITTIAFVTVVAGMFVYWRDVQLAGSLGDFLGTDFGLVLTVGAVFGIVAAFWGYFQVGRGVEQLVELAGDSPSPDAPPPPSVAEELERRAAQLKTHSIVDLLLQLGAVIAMSTARYW
jgi:uncharacterized membrane protein